MTKQMMMSVAAAISSALLAGHAVLADAPTTQPTTQPSAVAPAEAHDHDHGPDGHTHDAPAGERGLQNVIGDLQNTSAELGSVIGGPDRIFDAEARAEDAEKVLPLARKMKSLMVEAEGYPEMAGQVDATQMDAILLLYGDEAVRGELEQAAGGEGDEAITAKATLIEVDYLKAEDEAGRLAAIDSLNAVAAENTSSEKVAMTYAGLMGLPMTGDAELEKLTAGAETLEGEMADMLKMQMEAVKEQKAAEGKLQSLVDQPLIIEGKLHDGGTFTSADLKGKVILVDFWATWCGPCIAELPRVKEIYAEYKDQGFEIVGVSCDETAEDLSNFLAENPEMSWPQLFDADNPGWHALATEYGIMGIPTMFLIDKNGVVRTVEARANMEEMIPQLLAE